MTTRATALFALLALAGCGNSESPSDKDLATSSDLAQAPDLKALPDLTPVPDLATPPDLTPPPDLVPPADLVMPPPNGDGGVPPPPPCGPSLGYAGLGGECGIGGMCNGHNYALDCDKVVCVCSFDGVPLHGYAQMPGSCQNLMVDWKNECGF